MERRIFVSVGRDGTPAQEAFIHAIEERLRSELLTPCTVNRNTWGVDAPLKRVIELMKECAGVVIIALERTYFPAGTERRGHAKEMELREVRLPTPFNQIEAAMAYCHKHPLLVIVEEGLRCEGLLEAGHDWSVMRVAPKPEALSTPEFHGILASWKDKVIARGKESQPSTAPDVTQMTISQLVGLLKPIHLWLILGALASLIAGAFSLGVKLGGH